MTITKKARLLPPPFVGTRIKIRLDDPESLTWGIKNLTLAEGSEKAIINWGDGTSTEITNDGEVTHTYAKTGEYDVRISDDIGRIHCSIIAQTNVFFAVYAPMIREFQTTASRLSVIYNCCFHGATNLHTFKCNGSGVVIIGVRCFGKCVSLAGRIDLPNISQIGSTAFALCPDITELHFSKVNEETIKASSEWAESDGNFGAENATVSFDL